jgi:hypothetical protein
MDRQVGLCWLRCSIWSHLASRIGNMDRQQVLAAYIEIWHLLNEIDDADGSYSSGARDAYGKTLEIIRRALDAKL